MQDRVDYRDAVLNLFERRYVPHRLERRRARSGRAVERLSMFAACLIGIPATAWVAPGNLVVPTWLLLLAIVGSWSVWLGVRALDDPLGAMDLIPGQAQMLARLEGMREAEANGRPYWKLDETGSPVGQPQVLPASAAGAEFWQRAYHIAMILEPLSPRQRRLLVEHAASHAWDVLAAGRAMAVDHGAALVFWGEELLRMASRNPLKRANGAGSPPALAAGAGFPTERYREVTATVVHPAIFPSPRDSSARPARSGILTRA